MGKTEKLFEKLKNETISADELRTLLKRLGWDRDRTKGSHEQWRGPGSQKLTIASHTNELPRYQMRLALKEIGE